MRTTRPSSTIQTLATVIVLALLAAACGSAADATPDVASAQNDQPTTTQPEEAADGPSGDPSLDALDTEGALLAYAECMRSEGVTDFADPVFMADGSFAFLSPGTADQVTMVEAEATCRPFLDVVIAGFDDHSASQADNADLALEFARCMRDNGVDIPDPTVSGGDVSIGDPDTAAFDPRSPEFQQALAICQPQVFGGIGANPDGGYSGGGGQ